MTERLPTSSRTARALVCIIVCMGIAVSIMTTSMRTALRMRRQMQHELQMEQTRWLLRAAIVRAANRSGEDSEYVGESWNVHDALPKYDQSVVEIQFTTNPVGDQVIAARSRIGDANQLAVMTQRSGSWTHKSSLRESNE